MDHQRRLSVLKQLLSQLTGAEPVVPQATSVVSQATPQVPAPDPHERKLQLLQSMLSKLQGS